MQASKHTHTHTHNHKFQSLLPPAFQGVGESSVLSASVIMHVHGCPHSIIENK